MFAIVFMEGSHVAACLATCLNMAEFKLGGIAQRLVVRYIGVVWLQLARHLIGARGSKFGGLCYDPPANTNVWYHHRN